APRASHGPEKLVTRDSRLLTRDSSAHDEDVGQERQAWVFILWGDDEVLDPGLHQDHAAAVEEWGYGQVIDQDLLRLGVGLRALVLVRAGVAFLRRLIELLVAKVVLVVAGVAAEQRRHPVLRIGIVSAPAAEGHVVVLVL